MELVDSSLEVIMIVNFQGLFEKALSIGTTLSLVNRLLLSSRLVFEVRLCGIKVR